jgi:hypothetical protein
VFSVDVITEKHSFILDDNACAFRSAVTDRTSRKRCVFAHKSELPYLGCGVPKTRPDELRASSLYSNGTMHHHNTTARCGSSTARRSSGTAARCLSGLLGLGEGVQHLLLPLRLSAVAPPSSVESGRCDKEKTCDIKQIPNLFL